MKRPSQIQVRRIFRIINGGTPTSDPKNWDGPVPWATPVDIGRYNGTLLVDTERTLSTLGLRTGSAAVPADSLIVSTRAPIGYVAQTSRPTAFNQGCRGLVPRASLNTRYYCYVFESMAARLAANGQGSTFTELSSNALASTLITALPPHEQRRIADFLDAETTHIDALISKKRQLDSLLKVRIATLRSEAFSAIGTWKLKRLLRAPIAYGVLVPRFTEPGQGSLMMRINALRADGVADRERFAWIEPAQSLEYRRTVVAAGDVVLSVVGSMGRSAIVDTGSAGANLNRPLARLQPRRDLPSRLLWHWTQTPEFLQQAQLATEGGSAQPTLNLGDLGEFVVGLPDDPTEWEPLLESLEAQVKPVEQANRVLAQQIALLRERRQALITAAVTGELEIPGAAA